MEPDIRLLRGLLDQSRKADQREIRYNSFMLNVKKGSGRRQVMGCSGKSQSILDQ